MYTELIITFILLIIAAAAGSPWYSHAISINYTKLNSSYEQYKVVKQVEDNNAFSNLSRNLSPPVTSNSRGLTNLAPGNSGGGSTTSTSGGSFSSNNRGAVNQLAPGNSIGSSNSSGLTNLAPGNSNGSSNSSGLTNLAPGNSNGNSNSSGLTNLAPGNSGTAAVKHQQHRSS